MRYSFWIGRLLVAFVSVQLCRGQSVGQKTYCNPIDINYQYNFEQKGRGISYRSGADPVIVNHKAEKGEYYLFVTISGAWWHSKDLVNWRYVKPDVSPHAWPKEDMCASAALSVGDKLYLFQSTFQRRPIWVTTTPDTGRLTHFNALLPLLPGAAGPWDPALFHDDQTDRWFMYFGSSNVYPLYGIELDFTNQLTYLGTARSLIGLRPDLHGWERFGPNHTSTVKPFIEGAWMTKHNGKYYLQYGAPGTEYNVYANGTYIGAGPLGPFTYAPNNPISYKPGGREHLPRQLRQLLEHWHTLDRREFRFRAPHRDVPGGLRPGRPAFRQHAFWRLPKLPPDAKMADQRRVVHRLDAAFVPQALHRVVVSRCLRRCERDR